MTQANQVNVALLLAGMLFAAMGTGCGKAYTVTMKAPEDITSYNTICVEEADVASAEQTEQAAEANARYARYAREQIIAALQQKSRFEVLGDVGPAPDSLTLQTTIRIVYGNRAVRYLVGFGAGSGSIDITMELVDASSNECKMEMHSNSRLSVGVFGGDMDAVIEKNIRKMVDEFVAQL